MWNKAGIFLFQKVSQENKFSTTCKQQDAAEIIHKKLNSNEAEYDSVEDSLSIHRTGSEIPYIINDKNVIMTPGQGKNSFNFKW